MRFGAFMQVEFPRFKPLEQSQNDFQQLLKELEQGGVDILDHAKKLLMDAKDQINYLEKTDASLRNTKFFQNDELKQMQTLIVTNSLLIAKIKMRSKDKAQHISARTTFTEPKTDKNTFT